MVYREPKEQTEPLQVIVCCLFHELAEKYGVDVDVVRQIVQEFDIAISNRLMNRIILSMN